MNQSNKSSLKKIKKTKKKAKTNVYIELTAMQNHLDISGYWFFAASQILVSKYMAC